MLEAQLGQNPPHRKVACPAKGRIHDLDIVCHFSNYIGMNNLLLKLRHILVVNFLSDDLIQPLLQGLSLGHSLYGVVILDTLHLFDDLPVLGSGNLGAVLPVYLIAIVFRRIVAGRYHDARGTAQSAKGKGKLWRRTQRFEHIGLDAVCRQAERRLIGKLGRHTSGIVCNGDPFVPGSLLQNKIGQSLGSLPHGIDVHAVGACTDDPPQSSSAEFQLLIKTLLDFPGIVLDACQFISCSLVKVIVLQPEFEFLHIAHSHTLLFYCFCNSLSLRGRLHRCHIK